MKKLITIILSALACACMAIGFAACGGGGSDTPSGSTPQDSSSVIPQPIEVSVTFDANGGAFADGEETFTQEGVAKNSTLTAPISPTRPLYTFAGWAKNKMGTPIWQFGTDTVTENITLYAVWKQKSGVLFSVDGASIDSTEVFMLVDHTTDSVSLANKVVCSEDSTWKLYYDKLGQMEIPTKIAAGKSGSLANGDNEFYLVVTSMDGVQVNVYTLTVHRSYLTTVSYVDGGNLLKTENVYTGDTFTADYLPEITGYTFVGWTTQSGSAYQPQTVWSSLTLTAKKSANTYTVTYDENGGNELSTESKTVTYDGEYTLTKPTRTGYTFNGWYKGSTQITDGQGEGLTAWQYAQDTTVTAKWTINQYAVNARLSDENAGSVTGDGKHNYGKTVTLSATTKSGYTFVGWYNGEEKLTEELKYTFTVPAYAVTYTAKWIKVTVVSNDTSAGTVSALNSTYKVGDSATITATTNIGGTFIGWYNGEEKLTGELSYTFNMPAENVTYTAKFEIWEEMKKFNFTSTATTCTITGVRDKTVTEITVPDYVTSIEEGAFSGCSSLQSITLPFVGGSKKTASDTYQYPFGYIFGKNSYTGGVAIKQYYCDSSTSITMNTTYYIPASLTSVTVTGGNILSGAFRNCDSLTSVTIGKGVTSIGTSAFYGCNSLTSVTIGNGVTSIGEGAFSGCASLTSITIPDSVTSIGEYAFRGCDSLTSITIPDSVTSIGYEAFSNCDSLTSVTIGNGVTSIGQYAFSNCDSLTSVAIGNGVTSIGRLAFEGCDSFTAVYITDITAWCAIDFDYLYSNPLYYAKNLYLNNQLVTDLIIPDGVTEIKEYAFDGCSSLTSITIPDSVASIGRSAFSGCSSLQSITIPFVGGSKKTASDTYQYPFGYIFGTSSYTGGMETEQKYYGSSSSSMTSTTYYIPASLTSVTVTGGNILRGAFYSCDSLTSITIPDSVTSIGNYAFLYCDSLTSITIPDSVTSIGNYAFEHCDSLTSITIPDSVTSIGSSAFSGCSNLQSITLPFVGGSKKTASNTYQYPFGYIFGTSSYTGGIATTQYYYGSSTSSTTNTTFYIPASLTSVTVTGGNILRGAFYSCDSLTSITIPDSVTSIGECAFLYCDSLTGVYITDIAAWCAIDFAAYSSNPLYYAKNLYLNNQLVTDLVIPDGVTSIGSSAFRSCSSLTSITIPDSVTSIGDYAFRSCSSLTSITIPDSVTEIGDYAFYDCDSLTRIVYEGTMAEWRAISKGSDWNYNTGVYTVTCTDGVLSKSES